MPLGTNPLFVLEGIFCAFFSTIFLKLIVLSVLAKIFDWRLGVIILLNN
jgi:hypothetical protein